MAFRLHLEWRTRLGLEAINFATHLFCLQIAVQLGARTVPNTAAESQIKFGPSNQELSRSISGQMVQA